MLDFAARFLPSPRAVTEDAIGADLLDLVKRCRDKDPEAWRAFLVPFQEIGQRALRSFRLPEADSDDVLSDALTALYAGGLVQFRGGTIAELIAFLKAVVRDRAIVDAGPDRGIIEPRVPQQKSCPTRRREVVGRDGIDANPGVRRSYGRLFDAFLFLVSLHMMLGRHGR